MKTTTVARHHGYACSVGEIPRTGKPVVVWRKDGAEVVVTHVAVSIAGTPTLDGQGVRDLREVLALADKVRCQLVAADRQTVRVEDVVAGLRGERATAGTL